MNDNSDQERILAFLGPFDDEWKSSTRSIRISGTVTSIRLENIYWRILAEIAESQELKVPQLLGQLAVVSKNKQARLNNFTSFVRVCCSRYLEAQAISPDAAADTDQPYEDQPYEDQANSLVTKFQLN